MRLARRVLSLVLLLIACEATHASSDAIVIIRPEYAGPKVDLSTYTYGEWILWPDTTDQSATLLSIGTGVDLAGHIGLGFQPAGADAWRVLAPDSLLARGIPQAEEDRAGGRVYVVHSGSGVSQFALSLALNRAGLIRTLSLKGAGFPDGSLLYFEAKSWDEVVTLANRADGRVLVIEYPPPAGDPWSRFWFFGKGWPNGLPVAKDYKVQGLIPARDALDLVLHPRSFRWEPNESGQWGGANRWLALVRGYAVFVLGGFVLIAGYVFGCGIYSMVNELRARLAAACLLVILLWPAIVLMAGELTFLSGAESWISNLALAFVAVPATALLVAALAERLFPDVHRLFAFCFVGLICTAASIPAWSLFSGVFSLVPQPFSPEAAGALLGYGAGTIAFGRGSGAVWVGRLCVISLAALSLVGNPWWATGPDELATLPLLALLIGESVFRAPMLLGVALLPLMNAPHWTGVTFAPRNLFFGVQDSPAYNLGRFQDVVVSPGMAGFVAAALSLIPLGDRFLVHQMRRLLIADPRRRALFWAAAAATALGPLQPFMLQAALVIACGALCALLYDGLRAL